MKKISVFAFLAAAAFVLLFNFTAENSALAVTNYYIEIRDTAISADEGASATVTVYLSQEHTSIVTVDYTTVNGTAVAGSDYTATSGTLSFAVGETSKTISIPILSDSLSESAETFTLVLSNEQNTDDIIPDTATITINDVFDGPEVNISSASSPVDEGEECTIQVSLSKTSTEDITVQYTTSDGTAAAGSDYTAASGTLTIPAGSTSNSVAVQTSGDEDYESDETFTFTISNPSGAALGSTSSKTITISNVLPEISFNSSAVSVDEDVSGGTLTVTVNLEYAVTSDVTVDYATASVTATAGSDYTSSSGTLTIPANSTSATFDITISDDSLYESSETFNVVLSNASNASIETDTMTVTIANDDDMRVLTFTDDDITAIEVSEGTTQLSIPYTLTGDSALASSADVEYTDGTATFGSTSDYFSATSKYTFSASSSDVSGNLVITIKNDDLYEEDETFTIDITNAENCTIQNGSLTITILDNDTAPIISISTTSVSVDEDDGTAEVTVSLDEASGMDTTFDYTLTAGTASAGSDYVAASGTLTISEGATTKIISIDLVDDSVYEKDDETFTVTISNAQNATLSAADEATVTIADDDDAPVVQFTDTALTVDENGSSISVGIYLSETSISNTVVYYSTTQDTAVSGSDYTGSSSSITIAAGNTTGTITVPILDDTDYEGDETFSISLTGASGATVGDADEVVITISEDEEAPVVSFDAVSYTIAETGGTVTVQVNLSKASAVATSFVLKTSDDSAVKTLDYTAKSVTVTVPAGTTYAQSVITILDDSIYDNGDEVFYVTLSDASNATLGDDYQAAVTIEDNEAIPTAGFTSTAATAAESVGTVSFTVTMDAQVDETVLIKYTTADVTAEYGDDYVYATGYVSIASGDLSGTITITIKDDSVYDNGDETFTITLSSPDGVSLNTSTVATVTLTDDEDEPTIYFSSSSASISEAASSVPLTIKLSGKSDEDVSVSYATSDGTAEEDEDYTAKSGTFTIKAGSSSGTLTVKIVDDSTYESTEKFYVTLTSPTNADLGSKDEVTVTIADDDSSSDDDEDDEEADTEDEEDTQQEEQDNQSEEDDENADSDTSDTGEEEDSDETDDSSSGGTIEPETVEEDDASGTITITINTSDIPEDATSIMLPSGTIIEINGDETIQIEVTEADLDENGDLIIVAIDDAAVALGSYSIDVLEEVSVSEESGRAVPLWIWILLAVLVVGLGIVILLLKMVNKNQYRY